MSQENVEVVRGVYAALNRRRSRMTLAALADPGIVIDADPADLQSRHPRRAGGAARDRGRHERGMGGASRFEPLELVDAGERVVVSERLVGKGKGSGVEVAQSWGAIWTVRDGRVVRMELGYPDREAALAAAELPA